MTATGCVVCREVVCATPCVQPRRHRSLHCVRSCKAAQRQPLYSRILSAGLERRLTSAEQHARQSLLRVQLQPCTLSLVISVPHTNWTYRQHFTGSVAQVVLQMRSSSWGLQSAVMCILRWAANPCSMAQAIFPYACIGCLWCSSIQVLQSTTSSPRDLCVSSC